MSDKPKSDSKAPEEIQAEANAAKAEAEAKRQRAIESQQKEIVVDEQGK